MVLLARISTNSKNASLTCHKQLAHECDPKPVARCLLVGVQSTGTVNNPNCYTDGSVLETSCGHAVVWQNSKPLLGSHTQWFGLSSTTDELFAIAPALSAHDPDTPLTIFPDSQPAHFKTLLEKLLEWKTFTGNHGHGTRELCFPRRDF